MVGMWIYNREIKCMGNICVRFTFIVFINYIKAEHSFAWFQLYYIFAESSLQTFTSTSCCEAHI